MSNNATPNPIESQLTPGIVLSIYYDTIEPPNNKFVVLLEFNEFPLFFFINSEINNFSKKRNELLKCQVKVLKEPNHPFLKYDSFIDCSRIKNHYPKSEYLQQIQSDPKRIAGILDQSTRFEIIRVTSQSKLFSQIQKGLIRNKLSF